MKYLIGLVLVILTACKVSGQDLDVYKHQKNSNFDIPEIPGEMTYEEFKILSTDLRVQDMFIAGVFPGHVHFKIGEKKKGCYILGTRTLGYIGWGYLSLTNKSLTKIILLDTAGLDKEISTGDLVVAYGSLTLIVGSFLYDWIHGKYLLDDKQNRIRYKYARKKIQLGLNIIKTPRSEYPGINIAFNF